METRQEVAGGERAAGPHETPQALGGDEIGAIVILLMAAASLHGWVSDLSVAHFLLRVLWWIVQLAAVARLLQQCGTDWLRWTIRHQPALCVLLSLAVASCLWSLAPAITLQKAASLVGTTVLGVFIGYTCPPQRLMRVLYWTFALLIVSSIVVVLLLPAPVTGEPEQLGWSGIMVDKNNFGAAAVFATIFFVVSTLTGRVQPVWGATLCILCLFAVVQARSRTSYAALGVSLAVLAYLASASADRRPTRATLRRLSLGLILGVSVVPLLLAPLKAILRDNDPLKRTHLWAGALTILRERPLTGYGYAVVWGRSDATLLPHVAATAHPSAASAHNDIVQVATELGIPAAIVACVYLFGALSNAARLFEREASTLSFLAVGFLVGTAVLAFAETYLLRMHSFVWILFVALTVAVKHQLGGRVPTARIGTDR
jgi:exopolysaccharide production protein ExoQ